MRMNTPVTSQEYLLHEDQYLISRTDTKGNIIYANPAFVEASGFSRDELMGAPHNIVRHPDMPEEAFADLWRTIQAGHSWTGVVKNRRKDGGYYWVLANVTPIEENGRVVCYASVRVRPDRAQVQAAEAAYRRFKEGDAHALRIRDGQVRHAGWRGALSHLKIWRVTGVRARLLLWAMVSSALLMTAGGAALYGMWDRLQPQDVALGGGLLFAGVAIIFASGWGFARSISGLLSTATDFTRQIAAGNLSTPLTVGVIRDEVSALAFSLEVMRKSLVSITRDVGSGVDTALSSASRIAEGNADLSTHTEHQAASLEEAAASMQELASTVKRNADNAGRAHELTRQAASVAGTGGAVVEDAVTTMRGIADSSARIADIVSIIDGIAFQTNILALNASVEAARAGESGRGFAVVAAEVRSLAQRSAQSAREIKELISASHERVTQGVEHIERAGSTMSDIVTSIGSVTDIMGEIADTTVAQRQGIESVSRVIADTDNAAQQNAARVEQARQAVDELRLHSEHLRHAIEVFRVGAEGAPRLQAHSGSHTRRVPMHASRLPGEPSRRERAKTTRQPAALPMH